MSKNTRTPSMPMLQEPRLELLVEEHLQQADEQEPPTLRSRARAAASAPADDWIPPPRSMNAQSAFAVPSPSRPSFLTPPLPLRSRTIPPPPPSITRSVESHLVASSDTVNIRDLLTTRPSIVDFDSPALDLEASKFHSVAPVSMSSTELEDLPEPSKVRSRVLFTATVAAALVSALYIYRMSPLRGVVAAAQGSAFASPLAGLLTNDPFNPEQIPTAHVAVGAIDLQHWTQKPSALAATTADQGPQGSSPPQAASRSTANRKSRTDRLQESVEPAQAASSQAQAKTTQDQAEAVQPIPPEPSQSESVAPPPPVESLPEFSASSAQSAITAAASAAGSCLREGDPSATVHIAVTFAPSGNVTTAWVEGPPFAGTPQGGCIAKVFRSARTNPFSGGHVTVRKAVRVP